MDFISEAPSDKYFNLAVQSLDCEHESLQRVQVGEYTFEHRFTPGSGACLFACTVFHGPLIGYCATYENEYIDLIECVVEAIKDLL